MEQREDAEDGVCGTDVNYLKNTIGFGVEIAVREHDAFRIARGAGTVENHGDVVSGDRDGLEVRGALRKNGAQVGDAFFGAVAIDEDKLDWRVFGGFAGHRETLAVGEEQHSVGVEEEFVDLVGVIGGVKRYGGVGGGEYAEVGGHPERVIGGEESALRAARDVGLQQPVADGGGHVAQLRERVALDGRGSRGDGGGLAL